MRHTTNTTELAARLRERRSTRGLTLRQAANEIGVSHTTLSRVLRETRIPDRESLLLLARWLGKPIEDFLSEPSSMQDSQPQPEQTEETYIPELVARHLRADRRLKPEDVETLMLVFRTMYESFRTRNEAQSIDTETET